MKTQSKKLTTLLLALVSLSTIVATMYFNYTSNKVSAVAQEDGFYASGNHDNLFTVNEYGDLDVFVIRKDNGAGTGPVAYSLNKQKLTPSDKTVLYTNDTDLEWT